MLEFSNPLSTDEQSAYKADALIKNAQAIALVAHPKMDGDAAGSLLAFYDILLNNYRKPAKHLLAIQQSDYTDNLKFLPHTQVLVDAENIPVDFKPDLLITLDVGSFERVKNIADKFKTAKIINFDHHPTNENFGDVAINRPDLSSTGEILFYFAQLLGINISQNAAICLYVAILTDSGRFTFSNTKTSTLFAASKLVALSANPAEIAAKIYRERTLEELKFEQKIIERLELYADGLFVISHLDEDDLGDFSREKIPTNFLVNTLKSLANTQIAAVVVPGINFGEAKISLRGEGYHDLGKLAREFFGGGGHYRAAAATLKISIRETKQKIIEKLEPLCKPTLPQKF